jgi:hypothetical protein
MTTTDREIERLARRCEEHAKPQSKHPKKIQELLHDCINMIGRLANERDEALKKQA